METVRQLLQLAFLAASVTSSQSRPTVAISINTPSASFTAGQDIKLDLIVKNISQELVTIFKATGAGGEAEAANSIEVRDVSGNLLPRADVREIKKNERTIVVGKRWMSRAELILQPGEEFSDYTKLNRLFDLTKPGTYSVNAIESIPSSSSGGTTDWIKLTSNTIQITIKAKAG